MKFLKKHNLTFSTLMMLLRLVIILKICLEEENIAKILSNFTGKILKAVRKIYKKLNFIRNEIRCSQHRRA